MPFIVEFAVSPPPPFIVEFGVAAAPFSVEFGIAPPPPFVVEFGVTPPPFVVEFGIQGPVTPDNLTINVTCNLDRSAALTVTVAQNWTTYEPLTVVLTGANGTVTTEVDTDSASTVVTASLAGDDIWTLSVTGDEGDVLLLTQFPSLCHGYACFRDTNRAVQASGGDVTTRWKKLLAHLNVIPALVQTGQPETARQHLTRLQETCATTPDCGCSC